MNLKLEAEYSKADIFKEIDDLKHQIDAMRPLPADVEGRVMQKLRLDWNYHSNAIEGNRLNYGETVAFLMEGITAKGKPLKDHLDIRGHNEAINFLLDIVKDARPVTEIDIRDLHKMTLVETYEVKAKTADGIPTKKRIELGIYKTSPNHVETSTGEIHYYASPEETPAKMQELMEWYTKASEDKNIHSVAIAALFHHKFVAIHPFDDGNGRLSRLLMNLILMRQGYPPIVIKMDDRQNYYALLSRADNGDSWPFVEYIAERLIASLQTYLKAANGGDIEDNDDIDKKIALFKMEIGQNVIAKERKTFEILNRLIKNVIDPFVKRIFLKSNKLDDLFFSAYRYIEVIPDGGQIINIIEEEFNTKSISYVKVFFSESIFLKFVYKNFKNPTNDFDIDSELSFVFEEYHYILLNSKKEKVFIKLYNEIISVGDEKEIIDNFINDLMKKIENKLR